MSTQSPTATISTSATLSPTASTSGTAHPTLSSTTSPTSTATGTTTNTSYLNITHPLYNQASSTTTDPIGQNGYIGIGIGSAVGVIGTLVGLSHLYKSYKLKLKRIEESTPVVRENPLVKERLQIRYVEKGTNTPPLTPRNSGDSFEALDLNDSI